MSEVWFPMLGSQRVAGRVIEIEKTHGARSREEKRTVNIMVPVMASRVAGEHDISHQEIKEHNRSEICARFPGAWEDFQRRKDQAAPMPAELPEIKGTPIDRADFIVRDKLAWLKLQGFSTVEQIAAIDDAQMQKLGPGARTWKKKAATMLKDKG